MRMYKKYKFTTATDYLTVRFNEVNVASVPLSNTYLKCCLI